MFLIKNLINLNIRINKHTKILKTIPIVQFPNKIERVLVVLGIWTMGFTVMLLVLI